MYLYNNFEMICFQLEIRKKELGRNYCRKLYVLVISADIQYVLIRGKQFKWNEIKLQSHRDGVVIALCMCFSIFITHF